MNVEIRTRSYKRVHSISDSYLGGYDFETSYDDGESIQPNTGRLIKLGHDNFLPHPFQLIVQ
jgi:hypothetical protein